MTTADEWHGGLIGLFVIAQGVTGMDIPTWVIRHET